MKPAAPTIIISAAMLATAVVASHADVLRSAAVGCTAPADAEKIAALQSRRDKAGVEALARPLVASRACIDFAKGVKIDIDEKRPPLACVRLRGDLSCYWIAASLVDEHPGEKGSGGGKQGGGRRH